MKLRPQDELFDPYRVYPSRWVARWVEDAKATTRVSQERLTGSQCLALFVVGLMVFLVLFALAFMAHYDFGIYAGGK